MPGSREKQGVDARMLRATTGVALVVALFVAIFPPVLQFYYGYQLQRGSVTGEAKARAWQISQLAGRNPQMWHFETLRLEELLGGSEGLETKQIVKSDGALVTALGETALKWPTTLASVPVFDAGIEVASLKIERSLRPGLVRALMMFSISATLAVGAFIVLRVLPLGMLRRVIDRAAFLASHDALTELPNRALFNDWLTHAIGDSEREDTTLAVLCLDLDHFKEVNDILGHAAGDILLRQAAARMKQVLRKNDILARLGGDEFAVIQTHVTGPTAVAELAERLIRAIAQPFDLDGQEVIIGASIGITILSSDSAADGSKLLQQADLSLYRAKADGRGKFCFFMEEMNQQLLDRKRMETDLRKAIANDELQLHFQPQIDLATNGIIGVEVLLRWNHPAAGSIPPDRFIPLAEETGLILPIGEWVLREACREARKWPELSFAVNVSPVQFRHGDLVETIRAALAAEGVDPRRLEIEITEGVLLNNTEEVLAVLTDIQAMGVRVAMDDFGTGYSSLSYLRRFNFDKIKIDKSFVSGLGSSADADSIIRAVISLGASLGMTSNAEGVETAEQADLLREVGCNEVQGYHFAHPMPASSICELIKDREFQKEESTYTRLRSAEVA